MGLSHVLVRQPLVPQISYAERRKLKVKKAAPAKEAILKYSKDFNGSLDDPACIKVAGVSRNTFYKYKRELRHS